MRTPATCSANIPAGSVWMPSCIAGMPQPRTTSDDDVTRQFLGTRHAGGSSQGRDTSRKNPSTTRRQSSLLSPSRSSRSGNKSEHSSVYACAHFSHWKCFSFEGLEGSQLLHFMALCCRSAVCLASGNLYGKEPGWVCAPEKDVGPFAGSARRKS